MFWRGLAQCLVKIRGNTGKNTGITNKRNYKQEENPTKRKFGAKGKSIQQKDN
jgi:hypothetical protein